MRYTECIGPGDYRRGRIDAVSPGDDGAEEGRVDGQGASELMKLYAGPMQVRVSRESWPIGLRDALDCGAGKGEEGAFSRSLLAYIIYI